MLKPNFKEADGLDISNEILSEYYERSLVISLWYSILDIKNQKKMKNNLTFKTSY